MSSHRISLIFMGIALTLFVIIKISPKFKSSKTHVTGRVHINKVKNQSFSNDAKGWFVNSNGETVAVMNLELAETKQKIDKGLTHRKTLEASNGILFVFPDLAPQTFWMKDTFIPLDVLFMNESGVVVNIVENTVPHSLDLIKSKVSVKYVLEVNSGFVKENRLRLGSKLTFEKIIK